MIYWVATVAIVCYTVFKIVERLVQYDEETLRLKSGYYKNRHPVETVDEKES